MITKGNECHTINNAIFFNKSQADKSRKSQNGEQSFGDGSSLFLFPLIL